MDDPEIVIGYDDVITVEPDPFDRESDDVVVRVAHASGLEQARWLLFDIAPGRDRAIKINELIGALQKVRDRE